MVTQPTDIRLVGGLNPSLPTLAPPPAAALKFVTPGLEPRPAQLVCTALPLDRRRC